MKTKHGLLIGFAVIAMAAIFTLTGCPTDDDDGGSGDSGNTVDGLVFTAKETRTTGGGRGRDDLYLLSDSYDAALTSLTTKFGNPSSTNTVLGNSNLQTGLATNAPNDAVLYIVETGSSSTTRYLAKKESGSWGNAVSWD